MTSWEEYARNRVVDCYFYVCYVGSGISFKLLDREYPIHRRKSKFDSKKTLPGAVIGFHKRGCNFVDHYAIYLGGNRCSSKLGFGSVHVHTVKELAKIYKTNRVSELEYAKMGPRGSYRYMEAEE